MNRQQSRLGFEIPVRMTLAETDLDIHDDKHDRLAEEIIAVKKVLVGILISITTGVIALVLASVVKLGPS